MFVCGWWESPSSVAEALLVQRDRPLCDRRVAGFQSYAIPSYQQTLNLIELLGQRIQVLSSCGGSAVWLCPGIRIPGCFWGLVLIY